jgi:hypothetical protein
MHFIRHLTLVLVVAAAGFGALATSAAASTLPAAGSFVEGPEVILDERQSGGNDFIHLTRGVAISGTYSGAGVADQYIVIHSDGTFNFHQTIAFTGLACGQPVTLEFSVVGQGSFTENVLMGTYSVTGPTDVGGGNGVILSQPGVGGSYDGKVHCG